MDTPCVFTSPTGGNLYLGDVADSRDDNIRKLNCALIVSCSYELSRVTAVEGVTHIKIPLKDTTDCELYPIIDPVLKLIQTTLYSGKHALIHCTMGVSRSASVAIAYIMAEQKLDFELAHQIVWTARKTISPNLGFCFALEGETPTNLNAGEDMWALAQEGGEKHTIIVMKAGKLLPEGLKSFSARERPPKPERSLRTPLPVW